ncbi:MAG TPA: DUF5819 family protein [Streptomyces sp.]|jgi:hypothetical protein|nr:DUF5819 family protein [Streptomyces sp.]
MEDRQEGRGGGIATLSLPGRIVVAVGAGVVAVAVAVHLAMVFLHVAPENTMSRKYGSAVDEYIYPEFEQNWKLFAPNPLQQNIAVHARARVRLPDGTTDTTGWVNLSAMDGEHIRGNPFPSHVSQNELRRAWDFYTGSHDAKNKPDGLRGELSKQYVKRIVMGRFGPRLNGGTVEAVQVRSATERVPAPAWSGESYDTSTEYRVLPWWPVTDADVPGSSGK